MLIDYRCAEGHVEERLVSRSNIPTHTCSCGKPAKRVFSTFSHRKWALDRSDWALVAPLNEEGRPLTMREAAKVTDAYSASEGDRERRRLQGQESERERKALDEAKREAWNQVSAQRRITVRD